MTFFRISMLLVKLKIIAVRNAPRRFGLFTRFVKTEHQQLYTIICPYFYLHMINDVSLLLRNLIITVRLLVVLHLLHIH